MHLLFEIYASIIRLLIVLKIFLEIFIFNDKLAAVLKTYARAGLSAQ